MNPNDTTDRSEETKPQQEVAADVIRDKLARLYGNEPSAKEEINEVESLPEKSLSKHQQYMKHLSESGRSLAEIQTAWHQYYTDLPDKEKHAVWQEFYRQHEHAKHQAKVDANVRAALHEESAAAAPVPNEAPLRSSRPAFRAPGGTRKRYHEQASDIKEHVLTRVQTQSSKQSSHHLRSLAFGLSMGFLTVFILLFSFFNERFITPFIRPSTNVSATPIIVDPNASGPVGPESKIIIPKINVEAPVVYDELSTDEKAVQRALEKGVVHYATTPKPGEKGNSVIVGHSSSNILNKGKYKFAFLLLKSLETGDTFIVQKEGKRYVYKVYKEFVTSPTDVSVLGATDRPSTITLITCDPPGTSTNRLIIQAEQIFPDPNANQASSVQQTNTQTKEPQQVPGNAPSLWQRITDVF